MFIKNVSTLFFFFFFFLPHCRACRILVPWPGVEHVLPAVETWILNHWTAREVLPPFLFTFSWGSMVGFPGGSEGKASACNVGDLGSIPGSGRSPGEGNDNPLQYSLAGKSHGQRSLAGYSPWGHKELDMTEWLNKETWKYCFSEAATQVHTLSRPLLVTSAVLGIWTPSVGLFRADFDCAWSPSLASQSSVCSHSPHPLILPMPAGWSWCQGLQWYFCCYLCSGFFCLYLQITEWLHSISPELAQLQD